MYLMKYKVMELQVGIPYCRTQLASPVSGVSRGGDHFLLPRKLLGAGSVWAMDIPPTHTLLYPQI